MNNSLIAVIVVLLIAIVGYLAYTQGYFEAKEEAPQDGLNISIGGNDGLGETQ
jgi:hypothetical protein